MKISKAELRKIILEEYSIAKEARGYRNENEFAGMPFDDDQQEEHEQVAIEKKHIEDSVEEMLIHINKTEVASFLRQVADKMENEPEPYK